MGFVFRQTSVGDNNMHMRVIVEPARMSVQHRRKANVIAAFIIVHGKGFQGAGSTAHEQVIHHGGMLPGDTAQFVWQGEGHHKVINRKKLD
jgi:hypothetical protein